MVRAPVLPAKIACHRNISKLLLSYLIFFLLETDVPFQEQWHIIHRQLAEKSSSQQK